MSSHDDDPIETYLDSLLLRLRPPARAARRLLAETESHLREAADHLERTGLERRAAESEAVRRFGDPAELAAADRSAQRPSAGRLAVAAAQSLALLAGIGLVAVGVSGLVAALMDALAGPHFVGALPETYSRSACLYWLHIHPGATTCGQAAMLENSQDAVSLRLVAGLAGLALLAARWVWRRLDRPAVPGLPVDGVVAVLSLVAFAAAAVLLGGASVQLALQHGSGGVGLYLSGGIVAALACLPCGVVAYRELSPVVSRARSRSVVSERS